MKYLDLTFPTPEQNLACDEVLLDRCEENDKREILRVWTPQSPFVVLGFSNKASVEVDLEACQANKVPVLRRCSGGGTILQGPGCLNYSLILQMKGRTQLNTVSSTNTFIMLKHQQALTSVINQEVCIEGHTDLAIRGLKFSGNAQRRKRNCLLFHGTFLLDFDIATIEQFLRMPTKQPSYRDHRSHRDFLTNINSPAMKVKEALKKIWGADEKLDLVPSAEIDQIAKEKYGSDAWNFRC